MKKIEKKTGRRASRKRRKMEKLALKVSPETEQAKCADLSDNSTYAPRAEERLIASERSSPKVKLSRSSSSATEIREADFGRGALSATGSSGSSLQQLRTDSSRSSIRRRRRMKRIREELKKQQAITAAESVDSAAADAVVETSPNESVDTTTESAAAKAASVIQKVSDRPKDDSDPTAQSMVAIAGAVTALASAIQFRLTDAPEPKSIEHDSTSATSGTLEKANSSHLASVTSSDDVSEPLSTTEVSDRDAGSDSGACIEATSSDRFDDSFFDDDESDVAGAYTVLPPTSEPEESYREWFHRVVVRNKWITWFTAFYVHWLILLLMMVVFVHGTEQTANLLLNGAFADSPPVEVEPFEMSVAEPLPEANESEEPAAAKPVAEMSTVNEMAEESLALSDSLLSQFSDQSSESDASSEAHSQTDPTVQTRATPATSVSQGSFSVWTEPEYPNAGEPYRIIVQIQLPPNTKDYHLRDLNGVVVGSDGYRKTFPGANQKPLQIVDGCVRLVVPIVSADEHVKDTIFIRSRLLKETQKLLLEF